MSEKQRELAKRIDDKRQPRFAYARNFTIGTKIGYFFRATRFGSRARLLLGNDSSRLRNDAIPPRVFMLARM